MAYTMEDFQKDYVREHLGVLSNDEILKRFSREDRLKGLSNEDRLKGLSNEDRLKGLSLEEIQGYLEKQKKTETNHNNTEGAKKRSDRQFP